MCIRDRGKANVAVWDTAFGMSMPEKAYLYAIPHEYYEKYSIRRYGFHGTSHMFVSGEAIKFGNLDPENAKVIVCHLGNGASVSASIGGKCVDTSMGPVSYTHLLALTIFDKMKSVHGLDRRERLLLQIAVLLHDCGKYINMAQSSACSYNIIMATEIIGLSHAEREMVANVVRFNSSLFMSYEELAAGSLLDREEYLIIAKLTAILRVANALDRSHKQKIKDIKVSMKGGHTMQILVDLSLIHIYTE